MTQTVIQYVLSRLKELGVTDMFGCPGDFVYPVCDAIIDDPDIRWIGCANEPNASYAADGYARTKGVGVVVSTYGAGELWTFGGLARGGWPRHLFSKYRVKNHYSYSGDLVKVVVRLTDT